MASEERTLVWILRSPLKRYVSVFEKSIYDVFFPNREVTMNGLVIFIWLLGVGCGYWLARVQLRGRFELAAEAIQDARSRPMEPTPVPQPSEPKTGRQRPDGDPLQPYCENVPLIRPSRRVLKRFPNSRVSHFKASQIIGGYDAHGFPRSPQFPGGLEEWNRVHGFVTATTDDEE